MHAMAVDRSVDGPDGLIFIDVADGDVRNFRRIKLKSLILFSSLGNRRIFEDRRAIDLGHLGFLQ